MKKLNWFKIASLYIGAIMGAGFASGRECWQYFGVFGKDGIKGIIVITIGFVSLASMMTYIARSKNSYDIGKIVSPFNNPTIDNILGIMISVNLYMVLASMSAAGGSLLEQQFGISKFIGGLIIVVLVIYTVLGNFARISHVFSYLSPVLLFLCLVTVILVINHGFTQSGSTTGYSAGKISPTWWISALIYLSYNSVSFISMSGNSALTCKSKKDLYVGTILGTATLGGLTFLIFTALLSDMAFSASLDLPMLGFSLRISNVLNIIYAIVLYFAIYSAASSAFYAFSTKLPDNKYKNALIILGAIIAFFIGLIGFKAMVEFLYSIMGYLGLVYIIFVTINFFIQFRNNNFKLK